MVYSLAGVLPLPQRASAPTTPAIRASGLQKRFGEKHALDGVDLVVPAGTVYGLLGPNGAGKTTTVRVLSTLTKPDAGTAEIFGHDLVRAADTVRGMISLTGQYASVDEDLTGLENLVLLGKLVGYRKAAARERANEMLEAFGLTEATDRQVKNFSGGMRRRLDIAASILSTPRLLFLDEPTTGLDPRSRNQVWDIVRTIVAQGTTVLLTTQYLDEADQLASRIAVVDGGKVVAEGTTGELKASIGAGSVQVRLRSTTQRPDAANIVARVLGARVRLDADPVGLTALLPPGGFERAGFALVELGRAGIAVDSFSLGQPSLDEVFLALTNRDQLANKNRQTG